MKNLPEKSEKLALYHYGVCPFFAKIVRKITEFNLIVEMRNIQFNHKHRIELHQAVDKAQVPCLRVDGLNGKTQWLYKSDDIINYLAFQQNELFRLAITA